MNWKKICGVEEERFEMPKPDFEGNWRQERFEKSAKEGVLALQNGKSIEVMDHDGRAYELALEIKHRFILEYQKQLAEKIKIEDGGGSRILITFKKDQF